MPETLINFLLKEIRGIAFFKLMQLIEVFDQSIRKTGQKPPTINFKTKKCFKFTHSIVEQLKIEPNNIILYLNTSIFLTQKRANFLLKTSQIETEKGFVQYFINRFVWSYYNAFKKSHLILSNDDPLCFLSKFANDIWQVKGADFYLPTGQKHTISLLYAPYSIETFENILTDWFSVSVHIQLYFGQWIRRSFLDFNLSNPLNAVKAVHLNRAFLGRRVFLSKKGLLITIGPFSNNYFDFLPDKKNFKRLAWFLTTYLPIDCEIIVRLKLHVSLFSKCKLSTQAHSFAYFLGWTVRLSGKKPSQKYQIIRTRILFSYT